MKFIILAPVVAAVALSGCGGSSKPGYCSDRSKLEQSVKDLGSANPLQSGGVEKLKSQLQAIETNARTLANSAKSDFPTEASAIQSSASKLGSDVQKLPSSPSAKQVALVASDVKALVTSYNSFKKATESKC